MACDPRKIKPGDVFSRHSFGKIEGRNGADSFIVRNEEGFSWTVSENVLAKEFSVASQGDEQHTLTRTDVIEEVMRAPFTAMTVTFRKQVDPADVAEALAAGRGDLGPRQWRAKVNEALAGEERTMVGYHKGVYDEHRRLRFTEVGVGERLIDPRTIERVTVNGRTLTVK